MSGRGTRSRQLCAQQQAGRAADHAAFDLPELHGIPPRRRLKAPPVILKYYCLKLLVLREALLILKKKFLLARALLRTDPGAFMSAVTGRVHRLLVFSELTSRIPAPPALSNVYCKSLSDAELLALVDRRPELKYQRDFLETIGESRAYGVYLDDQLANISWLLMPEHGARRTVRHIKLRAGEAEIAACVTLPEHRGSHLYPFAIQTLCTIAREAGVRRVFMITGGENVSSQRGILRAGLRPCGHVLRFVLPFFPSRPGLILRGRRLWPKEVEN